MGSSPIMVSNKCGNRLVVGHVAIRPQYWGLTAVFSVLSGGRDGGSIPSCRTNYRHLLMVCQKLEP